MNCSLCGRETKGEKINFKLKYYTENQLVFAPKLIKKNYPKSAMALCDDCLSAVMAGENYVLNNMVFKFGTINCAIVPHIIFGDIASRTMIGVCECLKEIFEQSLDIQDLGKFDDALKDLDFMYYKKDNLIAFNVMFYTQKQQATKVIKMIKDVPFTFFDKLERAVMFTDSWQEQFYPNIKIIGKGLNGIYHLSSYPKHSIEFVSALLEGRSLNKNNIIREKLKIIKDMKQDGSRRQYIGYNIINQEYSFRLLEEMDILSLS